MRSISTRVFQNPTTQKPRSLFRNSLICGLHFHKVASFFSVMYSIKAGWGGKTLALAKNNESDGRKSRIRRSKEERKEMVVAFIRKYQSLNNGSFPSLNLTHKEVGGSFYTVREIVRDVIQENRVLGPAKFIAEHQTVDQFLEYNPLGSIAAEPQDALSEASNDYQFTNNQQRATVQEMVLASDGHSFSLEHQISDHGQAVNGTAVEVTDKEIEGKELLENVPGETENKVGEESVVSDGNCIGRENQFIDASSQVDQKYKQTEELTCPEHIVSEPLEVEKKFEEVSETSRPILTSIEADVVVETFPLPHVTRTDNSDGELVGNFVLFTEDKGTKAVRSAVGFDSSPADYVKSLIDDKVATESSSVGNRSSSVNEEALKVDGEVVGNFVLFTEDKGTKAVRSAVGFNSLPADCVKSLIDDNAATESSSVGNGSSSVNEEALKAVSHQSLESSNHSSVEGSIQENGSTDRYIKAPENDAPVSESFKEIEGTAGAKTNKAPVTENLNGTSIINGLPQTKQVVVNQDEVGHSSTGSQKGSNPTLDRINLESWQRASKKSEKQEGKPFWAVFKGYIDAFVKFWSE